MLKTSLTRLAVIDKKEYYISYFHDEIDLDSCGEATSLGEIVLVEKSSEPTVKKYTCDNLLVKNSVNKNLKQQNGIKETIEKIVKILEGKLVGKEVLKIDEEDKKLKIVTSMKQGINLVYFSCDVKIEEVPKEEILLNFMKYFKMKKAIQAEVNKENEALKKEEQDVNEQYINLENQIKKKEKEMLEYFCQKLNMKKALLRKLRDKENCSDTEKENDKENIESPNNNLTKNESSILKLDESLASQNNLSLSDL